jgi:hypothetical protein
MRLVLILGSLSNNVRLNRMINYPTWKAIEHKFCLTNSKLYANKGKSRINRTHFPADSLEKVEMMESLLK